MIRALSPKLSLTPMQALVIHTIGFAVDVAARYQLQCIARVARGKYFEADDTNELARHMSTAVETAPLPQIIKLKNTETGAFAAQPFKRQLS